MKYSFLTLIAVFLFSSVFAQHKKGAVKKAPAKTASTTPVNKASIDAGKIVYMQNCLSCHQVDGYGVQNMNPPLIKTSYVLGDKNRLISVLLNGLNHVEIDDETYQNVMPSHSFLTDKQIADVLTYVRNSFGNKASAVNENEVKAMRAKK